MLNLSLGFQNWLTGVVRSRPNADEPPLRAELFSVEQLTRHAASLAAAHAVATRPGSNRLLNKLRHNEEVLRTFNHDTLALDPNRRITPAAEWLLDNFYLIEEQIQMARRHLPRGYSRELPPLVTGPSAGLPRVYDIVLEFISHVDAQVDAKPLNAFIAAYQTVSSLKLGELWAIPIMLRLGLIENLQRITTRLITARADRDLAHIWVDKLQDMAEHNPSHLVIVVADMAKSNLPLSSSFVAEFCQRLSRQSPVLHLARGWLEQRLVEQGLSIEQLVHLESQNQAADQVSVSNSIGSLRFLSAMDWKEFVESLSLVETTLRSDPAGVYGRMNFATRDRYRHAVEFLARHSRLPEAEVAARAVQLAADSARQKGISDRTAHVGFYLIDQGETQLGRHTRVRRPWRTMVERGIHRFPLTFYVGGILGFTLLATLGFLAVAHALPVGGWKLAFFSVVFLLCASQLAVALMNWLATLLVKPRGLPRMDFSEGIPAECRTMVVVPTLLTSAAGIDRLLETMEIHYLANRDPHLHFALLTDFRDAAEAVTPADQPLLQRLRNGVEMLNRRYAAVAPGRFFLFHRPRRWNAGEGRWMGYERKRGKLAEFNALLRGGARESFSDLLGQTAILPEIKYVITLDTDTQLPRDAARQLVGTMAHPLNHPNFDPVRGVVSEGYAILQPRVGVSLPSARRSWFVRLFAGDAGIDPYTREVSDVYQDVFREGSFVGKGIYDVDAFERALKGRFPENTILSHDLLEACHARSALVSDVELYEEFPSRYNADMDRRHRWIRGDWQITQWLLRRVPGSDARRIANPLSGLSQWKIFDNLRRSLVPVGLLLLIVGSWLFLPEFGSFGLLLVVLVMALPGLLALLVNVPGKSDELPWRMHLRELGWSFSRQLAQMCLTLALLPYDAFISLDAIGRTLLRLTVTHKRMLEWQASGDTERQIRTDLPSFYACMWVAPVIALLTGVLLLVWYPAQLPLAAPLLTAWLLAPWIAWRISQPIANATPDLSPDQLIFLRRTARQTWHFFETFVTQQENWLPPDNFQEIPAPRIATRTSPTNMGLALLANLAARDFGYLSVGGLIRRTHDTLATMQKLDRYRGHFYNWYETRTLQPLLPLYVSSVDSGNLAGHLLTLGAGLREQAGEKILTPQIFTGLLDTVRMLKSLHGESGALASLETELAHPPASLPEACALLEKMAVAARTAGIAPAIAAEELPAWSSILKQNCEEQLEDLRWLAPWVRCSSGLGRTVSELLPRLNQPHTLRELSGLHESLRPLLEADAGLAELAQCVSEASEHARQRLLLLETLARQCDELAAMDFTFLFNPARDLFCTGYNVNERRSDTGFYDLLASEARLGGYVAIALGQIPQDHWFSMSRLLIASRGEPVLVSWSGSMFEYLMPMLVMPSYENTLLDQTCRAAVRQQIDYGKLRGVPWGIVPCDR